jgi:hypothetical protein
MSLISPGKWTRHFVYAVLKRYRELLLFVAVFSACGVMVVRQTVVNQSRHVLRLLDEMTDLSDRELMDDFQRTLTLVDPQTPAPTNMVWNYHWTLSNKLEKRAASAMTRAIKLANED